MQRVGALDHLVEGLERYDRRQRSERLLGHDLRVVRHVGDHRRLEEKALVALARAAGDDLAAAVLGVVDEALHGVEPARICDRAKRDALFQAVAHLEALGVFGEAGDELVVRRLLHVKARRRDADLPGVAVLERGDGVGGLLRVGVGEHHDRRMSAELHGGALHALGGKAGKMLAHRYRAGEGNFLDDLRRDQVLRHVGRHAEYEIEHARRQPGIGEALHQFDGAARRFFRGLDDERAAGGQRAGDLADRRQRREIPRREGGDHADRLLQYHLAYALLAAGDDAAIGAAAFLGVPVDDVGGGEHLGARLDVNLALLLGLHLGNVIVAFAHQVGGFAHDLGTVIGRGRLPHLEALGGGGERGVEVGRARMRQMCQHLAGRRIDHVLALAALAVEPFSVDEKTEL